MAHSHSESPEHSGTSTGHESRDLVYRPIVWAGIGFFGLCALACALVFITFRIDVNRAADASAEANPLQASVGRQAPPAPQLQAQPAKDLRELRTREAEVLTTYAWVDKSAGVVRIPIDRALQLLAERGLPARANPGGTSR
jgi:hypothetical protein